MKTRKMTRKALEGAIKAKSFLGYDFSGVKMPGAKLGRGVFWLVNFAGADLRDVDFHKADLRGTNFAGADLSGANFAGANLKGVNFAWANLTGANLQGAKTQGANFFFTIR